jgi:hypothetical protein
LTALEDLTQIAIGLCNGNVVLVTGDLLREKNPRQIILQIAGENPVTGITYNIRNIPPFR